MHSTRREASLAGDVLFFTGKVCKHGHVSPRYTSSGGCKDCGNFALLTPARRPTLPAQYLHPDDVNALLTTIDYLNAQRGLRPAIRPGVLP